MSFSLKSDFKCEYCLQYIPPEVPLLQHKRECKNLLKQSIKLEKETCGDDVNINFSAGAMNIQVSINQSNQENSHQQSEQLQSPFFDFDAAIYEPTVDLGCNEELK